jgi:succinylglutamate desuccinylase
MEASFEHCTAIEQRAFLRRELGCSRGPRPGPTLIVVGGLHGNEPAGTIAARRIFDRLAALDVEVRGEFVAFAGNLGALRLNRRCQLEDLNRVWTESRVDELRARPLSSLEAEALEQRELLECLEAAIARARGDVYCMDLHTTSARGVPFGFFGDTLRQRKFARAFPIPMILGLAEHIEGVLTGYLTRRGCIALAIEGGQHEDPASIDNLEAALWLALVEAGLVDRQRVAVEHARAFRQLASRRGGTSPVIEVIERHAIRPEDEFVMAPGFANLDRVRRGQLLARDRRGEIRASSDGVVILPLYQKQGDDGFFWGREVSELRMRTTEILRRMGLDRALPWLPGVRRDPERRERLRVDVRYAKLYPREVFRALGYRRFRRHGGELFVERESD